MPDNENLSLKESVEKAANEQNSQETSEIESSDEIQNDNAEESSETKVEKTEDFTPDPEIEEAINFYRALKDPSQQVEIIGELARRAGLVQPNQQPTKAEEKKYNQLIEEILGEEYPDLKEKMGHIFTAFEKEQEKKISAVRYEIQQQQLASQAKEFEKEYHSFITENNITEDTAGKMLKEIEQLPPGNKISLSAYLTKIHNLVNSSQKVTKDAIRRNEKIEQNLKDRTKNISSDIGDERLKKGSRLPSIKEAVSAAAQGIKFDE